ncbi:CsbD family protein [Methylobacterium sp. ARG-1]|uniref:CsbD family protein n=1 Tax=Methylobacterium sp. ARG-1 TaxID=1692501 RepID=UPI000680D53C|nr:CsbD family protein [Methylobacterium sp. ARG-1]KNY21690.1 hypothetical protein AKJ13_15735 [Methylobacterium sp. ARG-1]
MDENRIRGAAKELGGKVRGAVGDVTGDREPQANGIANEAKGTVENLYGRAKDALRDVADQGGGVAKDAIEQGCRSFPDAKRTYRRGADTVTDYAKESPLVLAAMAGAIGYLLAMVVHGRR